MNKENFCRKIFSATGLTGVPRELLANPKVHEYYQKTLHPERYRGADDYLGDDERYADDYLELIIERINETSGMGHHSSSRSTEEGDASSAYFNAPEGEWSQVEALQEHLLYHILRLPQVRAFQDEIRITHPENRLLLGHEVRDFIRSPAAQLLSFGQIVAWKAWPDTEECEVVENQTILKAVEQDDQGELSRLPFQRFKLRIGERHLPEAVEHDWRQRIFLAKTDTPRSRSVVMPHEEHEVAGFLGTVVGDLLDLSQGIMSFCLDDIENAIHVLLTGESPVVAPVAISQTQFGVPDFWEGSGIYQGPLRLTIQPGVSPKTLHHAYTQYCQWTRRGAGPLSQDDIELLRYVRTSRWAEDGKRLTWKMLQKKWDQIQGRKRSDDDKPLQRQAKDPWRNFRTRYQRAKDRLLPKDDINRTPDKLAEEYKELPTASWHYKLVLELTRDRQSGNPPPPPYGDVNEERMMGLSSKAEAYELWRSGSMDTFKGVAYLSPEENMNNIRWWASIHCYENADYEEAVKILQECVPSDGALAHIFRSYERVEWQMLYRYCARQFDEADQLLSKWKTLLDPDRLYDDYLGTSAHFLPHFIWAASHQGDLAKAVILIACLDTTSANPDHSIPAELIRWTHNVLKHSRTELGDKETARAWKRGKSTPVSDILALAIRDPSKMD